MANTQYILSLSYGKDSLACLGAIEQLGWPLDRIVHAEVWATDTIPADLPPMVEFKKHADAIIKERWGVEVEHVCAMDRRGGGELSYEKQFYRRFRTGRNAGRIYGFPFTKGAWCNAFLKRIPLESISKADIRKSLLHDSPEGCSCGEHIRISRPSQDGEIAMVYGKTQGKKFSNSSLARGANTNIVQYIGIASDEPERIARHTKPGFKLPLVEAGWDEAYCRKWCEENDLLSPIYTSTARGGCWFCHNQGVDQLRKLRKDYPDLWKLLLKWDNDSPVTFKPGGKTVHDFDKRFTMEDCGVIDPSKRFRWNKLIEYEIDDNGVPSAISERESEVKE